MSIEIKRVTEDPICIDLTKLKDVKTEQSSGWMDCIEELSFSKFQIVRIKSKLNLSSYGVSDIDEFIDLLGKNRCEYDPEEIISEMRFSTMEEIARLITINKTNFFNSNLSDSEFNSVVQFALDPMYWDAFLCTIDTWWSSKRQNEDFLKRLAGDGLTDTVILSNIFIKYRRFSDNQLISDNYPIVVSVPSCLSPINHPSENNYSVGYLGGLMSPSSRFVSCDATSRIDVRSSIYHETLHCIFNTLKDCFRNDMYGYDELSQFEEMVTHFNTDRFSSLERFKQSLANLRLVFDDDSDEILVISSNDDLSHEIQVDIEFDPSDISYLEINSVLNESDTNSNSKKLDILCQNRVPMVSSIHEEIAKRMVESNTYNLHRAEFNLSAVTSYLNNERIVHDLSCEQGKNHSNYHSFLKRIISIGGKK